jgi:hypothetical protein
MQQSNVFGSAYVKHKSHHAVFQRAVSEYQ